MCDVEEVLNKLERWLEQVYDEDTEDIERTKREDKTYVNIFYRGHQSGINLAIDFVKQLRVIYSESR